MRLSFGIISLWVVLHAAHAAPYDAGKALPEPALFAEGVISAGEFDTHPALSPDGREIYFVRSTPQFEDWKIFVSRYRGGKWQAPAMAPFSGHYRDADPYITPDGKRFYFISDRPVAGEDKKDMDIWVMERNGDAWGEPRRLSAPINSDEDEWYPHVAESGTIYFGSGRAGGYGQTDLYRARVSASGFAAPENLGATVNTAEDEYEPWIAPDESYLIFNAYRKAGFGGGDLYISFAKDGAWTAAKNLGPVINTKGLEISAMVSPNGRYFFFASARKSGEFPDDKRPARAQNGLGDIYQMDLDALLKLGR